MVKKIYGPTAMIVGGSVGIGAVMAEELASQGLNLLLIGRSKESLMSVRDKLIGQFPVQVDVLACDMTDDDAPDRVIAFANGHDVGLLAYIAGTVRATGFFEQDIDEAIHTAKLNALAPMRLLHHFGAIMRERGGGALLLTSSLAGLGGSANLAVYSASKAFGQMLMESLWAELRPYNVDALSLIVHATSTPGAARVGAKLDNVKSRRVMTSEEVARCALDNLANGPTCWAGEDNFAQADQFCTKERRRATELLSARFQSLWAPAAN